MTTDHHLHTPTPTADAAGTWQLGDRTVNRLGLGAMRLGGMPWEPPRNRDDALAVLRRFRKALESHEFPALGPEGVGKITISGGLASFPWDARDAKGLIERADQALLQAKQDGKNRIYLVGTEGDAVGDGETDSIDASE